MDMDEAQIREHICQIGHRLWLRELCAGNGGNISVRVRENEILCTPTLISKGFMKPEDICTVDLTGRHVHGKRKCTSEVKLHLEIYKARPDINAVIHCHAPHLTAYALARKPVPMGYFTEVQDVVGPIPVADYGPPGTSELAKSILPHVNGNAALLANHGAVTWSTNLEDAYFKMEVADAYCKIIFLSGHLGGPAPLPE